jgi:hypothetical protein
MPAEMDPDRDHNSGLDRRKLSFEVDENIKNEVHLGELGNYKKKRARGNSRFFRSGVLLCPYLVAIIFLLAVTPSVVRAQGQNDAPTMAPSVSLIAGPPTGAGSAPTVPTSVSDPSQSVPIPSPTAAVVTTTAPTKNPTVPPTISMAPSVAASNKPSLRPTVSFAPTGKPSPAPTGQPSWLEPSSKETKFRQEFFVENGREFNEDELQLFRTLYQRYTVNFSPLPLSEVESKITTICIVDKQTFLFEAGERNLQYVTNSSATPQVRGLEDGTSKLNVDYTMKYESRYYNVTEYPKLFQNWTTNNLDVVLNEMQFLRMNVTKVNIPKRIVVSTPAPSMSSAPSMTPTFHPTSSPGPSVISTENPSNNRGNIFPSNESKGAGSSSNIIIIAVSVIIAFSIILIGLFLYCRKLKANREDDFGPNALKGFEVRGVSELNSSGMRFSGNSRDLPNPSYGTSETKAYGSSFGGIHSDGPSRLADAVSSPPGSFVSSQSLISRGNSMGGDSRDEEDTAHMLVDEFDQYKDQNLEKMRADIEDLPECDGMMSQAVAKALIDQDDETIISDSYWGGGPGITAPEIEASALGFVLDFLKRNGKVSAREK